MGKYFIAAAYSLAAVTLVVIAVIDDSLRRSSSFKLHPARSRFAADLEFGILAQTEKEFMLNSDNNQSLQTNSSGFEPLAFAKHFVDRTFVAKKENFTYDPARAARHKYPDWIPAEIQNGWIFLVLALILSLLITVFVLGPERIQKKWNRWFVWYENSEHVLVGVLYPQMPINIANGIFSVVVPIFILRVLKVAAHLQDPPSKMV